jgi:phosphohistidine phosphatase SixA
MAANNLDPQVILVSPLVRAIETASINFELIKEQCSFRGP